MLDTQILLILSYYYYYYYLIFFSLVERRASPQSHIKKVAFVGKKRKRFMNNYCAYCFSSRSKMSVCTTVYVFGAISLRLRCECKPESGGRGQQRQQQLIGIIVTSPKT